MDKKLVYLSANEQKLICPEPFKIASGTVEYVEAHFELGDNWDSFDSIKAVWWSDFKTVGTILNSQGVCQVPYEVVIRRSEVMVNLVGSVAENDVLVERLTTFPVLGGTVLCDARVGGDDPHPATPSQVEQFADRVRNDANRAETAASNAETSAQNASDSATSASQSAQNASTSEDNAKVSELNAEAYKNQAQISAQNASESATDAEGYADEAESARDTILGMRAIANTLSEGSDATASYSNGLLTLGIPRGTQGEHGEPIDVQINGTSVVSDSIANIITEYVTPEMYGAAGDGTTDDAEAFEQALNSGKAVFVSAKSYYISRSIDNPEKIALVGSGRRKTSIKLGDSLFENAINNSIIQDIYFYCTNSGESDFYAFSEKLTNSRVAYCEFHYFDKIFYRLEQCCVITGNWFRYVKTSLCTQCTDAFITDNYLSGGGTQCVAFPGSLSTSVIQGNFFSYCYRVFSISSTMGHLTITGNIFDTCYCIFYNNIVDVTFVGNTISHLTKQNDWDVSDNNDMNTKSWAVMKRVIDANVGSWWVGSVFADNVIKGDFDLYMDCENLTRYPTFNLLVDEMYDASKFNYGVAKSGVAHDMENVMVRPMLKRTVESLPSADLAGNSIVSFDRDEVIYNGKLYLNVGGTWELLDNVQADWSQSTATADDYIKNKPTNVSAFTNDAGYLTSETDPTVPSWAKASSKPSYTFSEIGSTPTSISGYGIADAYTKSEVDGLVSGVLHYKGTKATTSALPSSGNVIGDTWHVTADGSEWAWDGTDWQELGTAVDLSGYVPTSRTVNGKALSGNITLSASDVGAIPAPSSPTIGAFLVWDGSAWVAQTLSTWQGGSY